MSRGDPRVKCTECGLTTFPENLKYGYCLVCYKKITTKRCKNKHMLEGTKPIIRSKVCACIDCNEPTKSNKHKYCELHSNQIKQVKLNYCDNLLMKRNA